MSPNGITTARETQQVPDGRRHHRLKQPDFLLARLPAAFTMAKRGDAAGRHQQQAGRPSSGAAGRRAWRRGLPGFPVSLPPWPAVDRARPCRNSVEVQCASLSRPAIIFRRAAPEAGRRRTTTDWGRARVRAARKFPRETRCVQTAAGLSHDLLHRGLHRHLVRTVP